METEFPIPLPQSSGNMSNCFIHEIRICCYSTTYDRRHNKKKNENGPGHKNVLKYLIEGAPESNRADATIVDKHGRRSVRVDKLVVD
jgi:hypothetical protein